ncbi:laccase-6-like isoform X1 [Anopheles albimanus]|uniref:Plastocyanin-like domain-containing protein n=1 Tax=Anopheles albimanus TaxID=7167 RepID=A0A182FHZ5_ANOAL|nr:laccase-6-like isoform X1 [Anopheles albimanus]
MMKRVRLIVLIVQRVLITAAVFFAAIVLIYFTAIDPRERYSSCDRLCNPADWPRICRFQLVIEKRTLFRDGSRILRNGISDNTTSQRDRTEQGSPSFSYYTVNGRYVGPTLTVCEHDFLVVDVENRVAGESIALHWTGQSQRRTPFMDGVPMITQCPIASYTRFQYKFQADRAGTQLYHGFAGGERTRGLLGALVVRSSSEQRRPEGIPSTESVWIVTEHGGQLGVNGERHWQESIPGNATTRGHRIRLLYASSCRYWLEVEHHRLTVLALDGSLLGPAIVDRVLLHDGLRMDLVLHVGPGTIKPDYEIRFTPMDKAESCYQRSVFRLQYEAPLGPQSIEHNLSQPAAERIVLDLAGETNHSEAQAGERILHLKDLHGDQFPTNLRSCDTRLEFTITSQVVADFAGGPFEDEMYHETVHAVNGFTFAFPSVLMLREPASKELRPQICGPRSLPRKCHPMMARCECVHVAHLEAGQRVEMVLINADPANDYTYQLHGHTLFVVGVADGHRSDPRKISRHFDRPPARDTIVVQRDSVLVVRFVASNTGAWLLRDIGARGWSRGLDVVLQVGNPQYPTPGTFSIPTDFPACHHFVGPRYFLI